MIIIGLRSTLHRKWRLHICVKYSRTEKTTINQLSNKSLKLRLQYFITLINIIYILFRLTSNCVLQICRKEDYRRMFTRYKKIAEKGVCHTFTGSEFEIKHRDKSNAASSLNLCLSVHPSVCPCDHDIHWNFLYIQRVNTYNAIIW